MNNIFLQKLLGQPKKDVPVKSVKNMKKYNTLVHT